jgi:hypothetical protein
MIKMQEPYIDIITHAKPEARHEEVINSGRNQVRPLNARDRTVV